MNATLDPVVPSVRWENLKTIEFGSSDVVICTSPAGVECLLENKCVFENSKKACWLMAPAPCAGGVFDARFFSTKYQCDRSGSGEVLLPGIYEGPFTGSFVDTKHPAVGFLGRLGSEQYCDMLNAIAERMPEVSFYVQCHSIRTGGVTYVGNFDSFQLQKPLWRHGERRLPKRDFWDLAGSVLKKPNIHFLGPCLWGDHWGFLRSVDVLLDFGSMQFPVAVNVKLVDYLKAGIPIVTDSMCGCANLVVKHGAGAVVSWRHVDSFVTAIRNVERSGKVDEVVNQEGLSCRARRILECVL